MAKRYNRGRNKQSVHELRQKFLEKEFALWELEINPDPSEEALKQAARLGAAVGGAISGYANNRFHAKRGSLRIAAEAARLAAIKAEASTQPTPDYLQAELPPLPTEYEAYQASRIVVHMGKVVADKAIRLSA